MTTATTLDGLFRAAVERYPRRVLIRSLTDEPMTFTDAARQVAATVEQLGALGFRRGQPILCYAVQPVPSSLFILAAAHAGLVPLPIPAAYSPEYAARIAELVQAPAVLCNSDSAGKLAALGLRTLSYGEAGSPEGVVLGTPAPSMTLARAMELLGRAGAGHGATDLCIMLLTSGSSGEPKIIMRSHRSMMGFHPHVSFGLDRDAEPAQRILLAHPLDAGGCGHYLLVMVLALGAEACIPTVPGLGLPLADVRKLDPTILLLPARSLLTLRKQYEELGDLARGEPFLGPSARILRTAGAYMEPSLLELVAGQGVDAGELYGMTEFGPVAITPIGGWRPEHVGVRFPDVEIRIAEDGELLVRSSPPRVMDGYFQNEELTRQTITDGFLHTGDMVEVSDEGYIRIFGRKRDVLRPDTSSLVYPAPVEALVEALPWVEQVVVVGDQRPFLAALVVVKGAERAGEGPDGYLDERSAADLYSRARRDLAAINEKLEPVMQLKRVALFSRPIPANLYRPVSLQKISRDRPGITTHYRQHLEELYSSPA